MAINRERIELGALFAEIVAALGVVISVIYLAAQVNESNTELKAQTHFNANIMANRAIELLVGDEKLAEIVTRGSADPKALSAPEWERFTQYNLMLFNAWEYTYYQHETDSTLSQLWEGHSAYMQGLIKTRPGLSTFWQEYQHAYAEPFNSYVDSHFPNGS